MKPKASVIIPVYNAEKTLRRCVESLVLGLERNIEVVLCEDCSKDNSWELCCELSEEFENVKCLRNEINSGVSFTRNVGLQIACGDFVLFVDSDDWVSNRYVQALLGLAKKNADALAICGQHFNDKVNGVERDFLWNDNRGAVITVETDRCFDLRDRFLLQQLWNKVFRRALIETHQIRFDESQSMGEDFQFVLDYMEAAQIKKCVVLNEPLYYYIRWNNFSLMSEFGFIDNQPMFARIEQLARIVGSDAEIQKKELITQIKQNYVYHIARNQKYSKRDKIAAIERIMGDGRAATYYHAQVIQQLKEQVITAISAAKNILPRVKGKMQRAQLKKKIAYVTSRVSAQGFSIISQNCIGGVFYHDMGLQFSSPTINLFIPEPDFVRFVLNLEYYLGLELEMSWGERWPIGILGDVRIEFMHYNSCTEAKAAWDKRKKRIDFNRIAILATDRNGFDDAVFEQWKQIPYPKVLFTVHEQYASEEGTLLFPEYRDNGFVPDLIPRREFYKDGKLVAALNQVAKD